MFLQWFSPHSVVVGDIQIRQHIVEVTDLVVRAKDDQNKLAVDSPFVCVTVTQPIDGCFKLLRSERLRKRVFSQTFSLKNYKKLTS